jgi:hypothetical protein
MNILGCILGLIGGFYFCYKDWSVYLATFFGACVVILFTRVSFLDTLTQTSISGCVCRGQELFLPASVRKNIQS